MFDVSISDDAITFVNTKTAKAEKLELFAAMEDGAAIRIVNGEIKHRENVSRAAVSLLTHVLDNPRLDGYKGQTPINETIPKELKAAVRELETEYLKPIFSKPLLDKGNSPAQVEKAWQAFNEGLRAGGSYANTKSRVVAYFAHCGRLPVADNGKLLTVAAIDKLMQNAKEASPKKTQLGLAGKLVAISLDIENRNEHTDLGDCVSAIAALKSMLATYEGLYREQCERMTELKGNISLTEQANAAIKAAASPTEDSLTAQWNNGQLTDNQFIKAMSDIGVDVELTE